jgi:hypothetical protein
MAQSFVSLGVFAVPEGAHNLCRLLPAHAIPEDRRLRFDAQFVSCLRTAALLESANGALAPEWGVMKAQKNHAMPRLAWKLAALAALTFAACTSSGTSSPGVACQVRQSDATRAEDRAGQNTDDSVAVAALTDLGVPFQLDPENRIRWIEAPAGQLTDDAVRRLSGLRLLEWLEIGGGTLTASGLSQLQGCLGLRRLYIHDLHLENQPMTWLSRLTRLEALSLARTGISGRVLRNLRTASNLAVLNLSGTGISDVDLVDVARFRNLEVLALQDTAITGEGLERLHGMPRLNVLNVQNCSLVDADLEQFTSMPNLRIVHAAGSKITEAAVKKLVEKLPMLSIFL